jgi:hydroxypyruvate reductase
VLAAGTHRDDNLPAGVEWVEASHPLPDERSLAAGTRALAIAARVAPDEGLLLLLSGGASALLAFPASNVGLEAQRRCAEVMMHAGADIHALNTVRKHLSSIKGGRLAEACRGTTITLAVSDVIGDDLSVIGSGPGVPDASTWADAREALSRYGGERHPEAVRARIARGLRGEIADTPKPGDPSMRRVHGRVIASRQDAIDGARRAAESLGYRVVVLPDPVVGEARESALVWLAQVERTLAAADADCAISAGETTVRVTGQGRGGRNQEFVLALVEAWGTRPHDAVVASVGTDGIDGPTDAAGAMVDPQTLARARERGLGLPRDYLDRNDSFAFFAALGDHVRIGRTDTNVGDLQVFVRR